MTPLPSSVSWLFVNLKFWFAFPWVQICFYIGIYFLQLFQLDFSSIHKSQKSLESHPASFCRTIVSPLAPLYTWFWLLGFRFWTKFWFGLFFFNMFKRVFTLCVCVNMYGVVNTLTKASTLPDNTSINLAVTVLRAEPAVLSLCSFPWKS